jgi:hypothetical protein
MLRAKFRAHWQTPAMSSFPERLSELVRHVGARGLSRVGVVSDTSIGRWIKQVDLPNGKVKAAFAENLCLSLKELDGELPLPAGYVGWLKRRAKGETTECFVRESEETALELVRILALQMRHQSAILDRLVAVLERQPERDTAG